MHCYFLLIMGPIFFFCINWLEQLIIEAKFKIEKYCVFLSSGQMTLQYTKDSDRDIPKVIDLEMDTKEFTKLSWANNQCSADSFSINNAVIQWLLYK